MSSETRTREETLIIYKRHPNQRTITQSRARFKVIACGRRFGKTTMAVGELVKNGLKTDNSVWWYVAPTYRQAKNIAWRMLTNYYFELPPELRGTRNESELWVSFSNGARIELKGADNEDSLRGVKLNGVVVDEVASIRNWTTLWQEVLRPSLTDLKGSAMFISTPKGFNHFHKLFRMEQGIPEEGISPDQDYRSFRFTSYDNPMLDPLEIQKAQLELSEDAFAQEYLADFRKQTGLIYKEFDRAIHIKPDIDLNFGWQYYRAMDFGAVNPTVCLWIGVDNSDNIYVFDEYYGTGRTEFNANIVKGKTSPEYPIVATFGDPSAEQEQLDYAGYEVFITPAVREFSGNGEGWVNSGIEKVRQALKVDAQTGRPRLYVHQRCVNTIREFETYHWREYKESQQVKDVPEKTDDHCMDALRYFIVSYGSPKVEYDRPYVPPVNRYTGYSAAEPEFTYT